jgi:2-O-methyltransferase
MEEIFNIIKNSFNRKKILFFEIGACDGYHSKIFLNMIKDKKLPFSYHIFEPCSELCDVIRKNVANDQNVIINNLAIGGSDGVIDFYKTENWKVSGTSVQGGGYYGSSSIRKPKGVFDAWKDMSFSTTKTNITTFDSYIEKHSLQNETIDFMWVDIQGAEVDMINGGKKYLKNAKYIFTEYCDSELYEGEIGLNQICEMLKENFVMEKDFGGDVLLKNINNCDD